VRRPRRLQTAILAADDLGTGLVDLGRFQVRSLHTPLVERLLDDAAAAGDYFTPQALRASWLTGDVEAGILPAGQVAAGIADLPTVGAVIEDLVAP
jgi:NAD(P)H-dependent flavin oxidoreductase YrpB (nitropropane dioxygenase family)